MTANPLLPLLISAFFVPAVLNVKLEDLKYQPDDITRESILRDHLKLAPPENSMNLTTMAYVTSWNPRGFMLARKTANRLNYVSPVWFNVDAILDHLFRVKTIKIRGSADVNQDFMRSLREINPNIKIVPRVKFDDMDVDVFKEIVESETMVQKIAQSLVNVCSKHGLDGLVIEMVTGVFMAKMEELMNKTKHVYIWEAMVQIAKVLKRNHYKAILSLPPPVTPKFDANGKCQYHQGIENSECKMLVDAFDHVHLWTYNSISENGYRANTTRITECLRVCGYSPKLMIGLNYFGVEYNRNKYSSHTMEDKHKIVNGKKYLEVLKDPMIEVNFDETTFEHETISNNNNTIIFYPTLTSLEYRMRLAQEAGVGVAFWDYGQGLDYFTNLI